jgi:hypothetical protein
MKVHRTYVDIHHISFNHIYHTIMTLGGQPSVQKLFGIAPPLIHILHF